MIHTTTSRQHKDKNKMYTHICMYIFKIIYYPHILSMFFYVLVFCVLMYLWFCTCMCCSWCPCYLYHVKLCRRWIYIYIWLYIWTSPHILIYMYAYITILWFCVCFDVFVYMYICITYDWYEPVQSSLSYWKNVTCATTTNNKNKNKKNKTWNKYNIPPQGQDMHYFQFVVCFGMHVHVLFCPILFCCCIHTSVAFTPLVDWMT